MGMCLGLTTVSDANIARIRNDPPLLWRVLAPDDPDVYLEEVQSRQRGGFWSKLFKKANVSPNNKVPIFDFGPGECDDTDLDKAWHGIHYLLTGSDDGGDHPLNLLLCGGEIIGGIDVGYGEARVVPSKEVQAFANALDQLDREILADRFDPKKMLEMNIYPEIWNDDTPENGSMTYCLEYFEELKRFIGEAAENGLGVVVTIE